MFLLFSASSLLLQLWRLVTTFVYMGDLGLPFILKMYFAYVQCELQPNSGLDLFNESASADSPVPCHFCSLSYPKYTGSAFAIRDYLKKATTEAEQQIF